MKTCDFELSKLRDEVRRAKEAENKAESQLASLRAERDSSTTELVEAQTGFHSKHSCFNSYLLAQKKELESARGELAIELEWNLELSYALRSTVDKNYRFASDLLEARGELTELRKHCEEF